MKKLIFAACLLSVSAPIFAVDYQTLMDQMEQRRVQNQIAMSAREQAYAAIQQQSELQQLNNNIKKWEQSQPQDPWKGFVH